MGTIENNSVWVERLNVLYQDIKEKNLFAEAQPINEIVRSFKLALDNGEAQFTTLDLARKIHAVSICKRNYYQSVRFGWIIELFSAMRNELVMGVFESSGEIGYELSRQILARHQREKSLKVKDYFSEEAPLPVVVPVMAPEPIPSFEEVKAITIENKVDEPIPSEVVNEEVPPSPSVIVSEEAPLAVAVDVVGGTEPIVEIPGDVIPIPFEIKNEEKKVVTEEDKMLETIYSYWNEPSITVEERMEMQSLWKVMMAAVKVVKWEEVEGGIQGGKRFRLEQEREVSGITQWGYGTAIIKKSLLVDLIEKGSKKILEFPDCGIIQSNYNINIPLKSVCIENKNGELSLTVQANLDSHWLIKRILKTFKQPDKMTFASKKGKEFWTAIDWM